MAEQRLPFEQWGFAEAALQQYVVTALWSASCNGTAAGCNNGKDCDTSLQDHGYGPERMSDEAWAEARETVFDFVATNWHAVSRYVPSDIGHDLWLTRNHHGAGFWDGDYPAPYVDSEGKPVAVRYPTDGDYLTAMAHECGESTPYVGDDGLVYYL